jgi:hypothetical protein
MKDYDLVAALEHIDIANDCGTDLVLDNEEVVALKKHLAKIRAEALKEAADRAVQWWHEGDCLMTEYEQIRTLRAAILAGEVKE